MTKLRASFVILVVWVAFSNAHPPHDDNIIHKTEEWAKGVAGNVLNFWKGTGEFQPEKLGEIFGLKGDITHSLRDIFSNIIHKKKNGLELDQHDIKSLYEGLGIKHIRDLGTETLKRCKEAFDVDYLENIEKNIEWADTITPTDDVLDFWKAFGESEHEKLAKVFGLKEYREIADSLRDIFLTIIHKKKQGLELDQEDIKALYEGLGIKHIRDLDSDSLEKCKKAFDVDYLENIEKNIEWTDTITHPTVAVEDFWKSIDESEHEKLAAVFGLKEEIADSLRDLFLRIIHKTKEGLELDQHDVKALYEGLGIKHIRDLGADALERFEKAFDTDNFEKIEKEIKWADETTELVLREDAVSDFWKDIGESEHQKLAELFELKKEVADSLRDLFLNIIHKKKNGLELDQHDVKALYEGLGIKHIRDLNSESLNRLKQAFDVDYFEDLAKDIQWTETKNSVKQVAEDFWKSITDLVHEKVGEIVRLKADISDTLRETLSRVNNKKNLGLDLDKYDIQALYEGLGIKHIGDLGVESLEKFKQEFDVEDLEIIEKDFKWAVLPNKELVGHAFDYWKDIGDFGHETLADVFGLKQEIAESLCDTILNLINRKENGLELDQIDVKTLYEELGIKHIRDLSTESLKIIKEAFDVNEFEKLEKDFEWDKPDVDFWKNIDESQHETLAAIFGLKEDIANLRDIFSSIILKKKNGLKLEQPDIKALYEELGIKHIRDLGTEILERIKKAFDVNEFEKLEKDFQWTEVGDVSAFWKDIGEFQHETLAEIFGLNGDIADSLREIFSNIIHKKKNGLELDQQDIKALYEELGIEHIRDLGPEFLKRFKKAFDVDEFDKIEKDIEWTASTPQE